MKQKKFSIRPVNKVYIIGLAVMFVLFAGISCYYSVAYQLGRQKLDWDNALNLLFEAYSDKAYSLAEIYEPAYHQDPDQSVMQAYFSRTGSQTPTASQFAELVDMLSVMRLQDNDIDWIALYNPNAEKNYFLARGRSQLSVLPNNFPYAQEAATGGLKLLGARSWTDESDIRRFSYCIKGGAIPVGLEGSILIGYSLEAMERILQRADVEENVRFMILAENRVVFDSENTHYDSDYDASWITEDRTVHRDSSGKQWFAGSLRNKGRVFTCVYMYPWFEGLLGAMVDTPLLLGLLIAFSAMALALYAVTERRIFRRVTQINEGLAVIGRNHLEHRLSISSASDEFDEISQSINVMTGMLQTAVDKEYEMRLKHMQLQLTQIQARFNPHFLYNTLEMIRGRLFDSGDLESADYIEKLARIFRNLTDAKSVIKLRDEISFCSLYVALLQLRSSGDVNVSYDVSPELLDCGVIANLIQPAIENYFVHALDNEMESNELEIICQPHGEADVRIVVADNGAGITKERLVEVNRQLAAPDLTAPNYGLMSIAKRIKLFYGDQYGVHLEQNTDAGTSVVIDIPRMSMNEHEAKLMPTK